MLPQQRPAPVTVIGYLNIIFGVFWGLFFLCGGGCLLLVVSILYSDAVAQDQKLKASKEMLDQMMGSMINHIPLFLEVVIGQMVFYLAMTLLLVVAGIGLLRLKPWARQACIIYAILSILVQAGSLVYSITVVNPGMEKVNEEMVQWFKENPQPGMQVPPQGGEPANPVREALGSVFSTLLFTIYPLIVLIIMLQPGVAAAFQRREDQYGMGEDTGRDDDYFGYDRREDWRSGP